MDALQEASATSEVNGAEVAVAAGATVDAGAAAPLADNRKGAANDPFAGMAKVKREFVVPKAAIDDEDRGAAAPKPPKEDRRGRNKKRPRDNVDRTVGICRSFANTGACRFSETCKFSHDMQELLRTKPEDLAERCPVWDARGVCSAGVLCRFGGSHIDKARGVSVKRAESEGGVDEGPYELNGLSTEQFRQLTARTYEYKCARREFAAYYSKLTDATDAEEGRRLLEHPSQHRRRTSALLQAIQTAGPSSPNSGGAAGSANDGGDTSVEPAADATSSSGVVAESEHVSSNGAKAEVASSAPENGNAGAKILPVGAVDEGKAAEEDAASAYPTALSAGLITLQPVAEVAATAAAAEAAEAAEAGGQAAAAAKALLKEGETAGLQKVWDLRESGRLTGVLPPKEKLRPLSFKDKVYIAPLTTVGNLPFRRVMKGLGADITCGEMALAPNLLRGAKGEWALLRRHPREDVFGVQVAGAHPDQMIRVAELLENEIEVDFVDINCGCPIDLICKTGAGAALMQHQRKLRGIILGMTSVLSCPITVKMRVGWDWSKPNAHSLGGMVQRYGQGSVAALMVHGRSRLQRYSKRANWEYIAKVAAAQSPDLPAIPVIGNGDILTLADWDEAMALSRAAKEAVSEAADRAEGGVNAAVADPNGAGALESCCMLARGALIKPWLPTEIKERRDWDISASERFEIVKKFVNYGLEHWGSDQMGVNYTRRFLLEWLSFTCRYIPVGILDSVQRINERPPYYVGRNDLETLLSSQNCADWIKITEMLLGKVPEGFSFVPKHKAASYAPRAQGCGDGNEGNGAADDLPEG